MDPLEVMQAAKLAAELTLWLKTAEVPYDYGVYGMAEAPVMQLDGLYFEVVAYTLEEELAECRLLDSETWVEDGDGSLIYYTGQSSAVTLYLLDRGLVSQE